MSARTLVDKEVEFLARLSELGEMISDEGVGRLRSAIAELAYYKAEQRGFAPGRELDDWMAAEAEVTQQWCGRRSTPHERQSR